MVAGISADNWMKQPNIDLGGIYREVSAFLMPIFGKEHKFYGIFEQFVQVEGCLSK